jgi:N6-L-threonylcarbamoyladenine synthase
MKSTPYTILGLETSCDETAASVITGFPGKTGEIRSNVILSQIAEHAPFGGVVPEIAARAHIAKLDGLVREALSQANCTFEDLDAVAATAGPGLIGGVIVGLMTAKGIAHMAGIPLIAVNHLEGHALCVRLTENVDFPYLLLLISGGHCQLLAVEGPGCYRRYGTTIDDAVGEAFDKTAKLLGLPYPGGPSVEQAARSGRPDRFALPRPMKGRPGSDFSFSGLKTAVRHQAVALANTGLETQDVADLCASFQASVTDVLAERSAHAMTRFQDTYDVERPSFVVAGGVAANQAIRTQLTDLCQTQGFEFVAPPPRLCTDNGAMIAWAGIERLALGDTDGLEVAPRARWPLDQRAALPGAKA